MENEAVFKGVKEASRFLPLLPPDKVSEVLESLADEVERRKADLLSANEADLSKMSPDDPKYDRLALDEKRICGIAEGIRNVASAPSPLGRTLSETVRPNGLRIKRVSVPIGVIGVIYEARPNVTFDVFSICFKSGNACILKGGKDADLTNRTAVEIIREVLSRCGVDARCVALLPATHQAAGELLEAVGYVDVLIPRGGASLISFVRDNSKVPVIETGAGVCHAYFDLNGDVSKGAAIIDNAKTRRVSVCNALDCLLIHENRLRDLPSLCMKMSEKNVIIYADRESYAALDGKYPSELLARSTEDDYGREFLDYKLAVKTVSDISEAIAHITAYGSGHSECIITEDPAAAELFLKEVDAACVYHNAPTSFSDGGEFGLGAEIGISTQKLHARGPMGLEAMTSYKWIIEGDGQVRK